MTCRVLVVDDHPGFRSAARGVLVAAGFEVVAESATAEAALRTARAEPVDLVLLDVRLPDRDGIEVAAELATLPRPPQVVLVSSRPASTYGRRLREAPVCGFLAKEDLGATALRRLVTGPCGAEADRSGP